MKIALLGRSPLALEAALRFHSHGAAICWFTGSDNLSAFESANLNPDTFVSNLGLQLLKDLSLSYDSKTFCWKTWEASYEVPLINYLRSAQEVKDDEVVSVTKRFLARGEEISERSRFFDLFRVIYKVNPKDFVESQKEANPETYQRLTEEMVNSLTHSIEMYQDFDLILDLRNDFDFASAAAGGRALGEGRKSSKVHYGLTALKEAKSIVASPDIRELALIGSDSLSLEILLSLSNWLKDPHSRLFVISTEEDPFKAIENLLNPKTKSSLHELFAFMEQEFKNEIEVFTKKLHEWQQLDDFVQVKIPRPTEPIPRLVFFSGHNVTAMDELIDRNRMFVTVEKPEFRNGKKQPENNYLDLKTVGVDQILVGHAKKNKSIIDLDQNEKGYLEVIPSRPNINDCWKNDLKKLEGIENEIFKLFSPASLS